MSTLTLNWMKCQNNVWCNFKNLDLSNEHFNNLNGVYIIWSSSQRKTIRVGSGIIKNRITDHRDDKAINSYPDLLVTWASVHGNQMEGVEKFLADSLNPLVGERFPNRTPIDVNLPW